jgi:heme-degrading monooxygenase HmoA
VFARSSTFDADLGMLDLGTDYVQNTIVPALTHIDGFVGLSLMLDRRSGHCVATSAWRTEQAMRNSADLVRPIRDSAAHSFAGDTPTTEEWQVAVLHRARFARPGTCLSATWLRLPADRMDGALDAFKFGVLTEIEDLPGFGSASLLVKPGQGRAVVTVGYDTREAMVAGRESGAALRDSALARVGAAITAMGEYDLAVARLHVPEMV